MIKTFTTMTLLMPILVLAGSCTERRPELRPELEAFNKWSLKYPDQNSDQNQYQKIFEENYKFIQKFNANNKYIKLEINQFAGLNATQFYKLKNYRLMHVQGFQQGFYQQQDSLPETIDYVEKGIITKVRDQGQCGSCFAMSAIEAIESAYNMKYNASIMLSPQQIVSCDKVDHGCEGGLPDNVFNWAYENGGLCLESDYPYTARSGECRVCKVVNGTKPLRIIDIHNDEISLQKALVDLGPISVAIEADQTVFQFYKKGIISGNCGSRLNHAVLLVGYGHDNETGLDYWKIKNSWSDSWGQSGYAYIERNKKTWSKIGECGISGMASFPVL